MVNVRVGDERFPAIRKILDVVNNNLVFEG